MRSICSSLNWIQDKPKVMRRIANDAFSPFLKLLRFSSLSTIRKFFSRNTCMETQLDGRTRWNGIVMDGTATVIIDKLIIFQRDIETLQAIKSNSEYQYIVHTAKQREFRDYIFRSAKKCRDNRFLLSKHSELGLESELQATHAHSTIQKFLRTCYRRTAVTNYQYPNSSDQE